MKTKSLYFGDNTFYINYFKNNPNIDFHLRRYMHPVLCFLNENPDLECFIFEAPEDTKVAMEFIDFFIGHFRGKKIFLVLANNKEQQKALFTKGVSDVFVNGTSLEKINKRIMFLIQKANSFAVESTPEEKKDFKLPVWKRTVDIIFAISAIIFLSPMLVLIAAAIRLESKGEIIYAAKRIGTGYKTFNFYKFRSMYTGADKKVDQLFSQNQYTKNNNLNDHSKDSNNPILISDETIIKEQEYLTNKMEKQDKSFFKMVNDPRITKVGRILRNTSLDELPQLFNILKGDMSVVGNRPLPLYEAETLTVDRWAKRFLAPSGLTGLWQVTKRGGANPLTPDERKQLDIDYANRYSFWGDIKIMFKTIPALVQHENV